MQAAIQEGFWRPLMPKRRQYNHIPWPQTSAALEPLATRAHRAMLTSLPRGAPTTAPMATATGSCSPQARTQPHRHPQEASRWPLMTVRAKRLLFLFYRLFLKDLSVRSSDLLRASLRKAEDEKKKKNYDWTKEENRDVHYPLRAQVRVQRFVTRQTREKQPVKQKKKCSGCWAKAHFFFVFPAGAEMLMNEESSSS
jgi:hypothetical protein